MVECGRPADWLCELKATYDAVRGWLGKRHEYRCDGHKEGVARRVGKVEA